jgi:hypothetical protein
MDGDVVEQVQGLVIGIRKGFSRGLDTAGKLAEAPSRRIPWYDFTSDGTGLWPAAIALRRGGEDALAAPGHGGGSERVAHRRLARGEASRADPNIGLRPVNDPTGCRVGDLPAVSKLVTTDLSSHTGLSCQPNHPAFRTLALSSVNPARPYICRLIVLDRSTDYLPRHTPSLGGYAPDSAALGAAGSDGLVRLLGVGR